MTALKVIGIILLVLFLIGLIRVGGIARYDEEGFQVWVRAGLLKLRVFPMKEKKGDKKPNQKKEKKEKPKKEEEPKEKRGGPLHLVKLYLPLVGEAAGALKRRIRIDRLELDLVWGAADAASAAMGYGYANAAIGAIWPLIKNNFAVKTWSFQTAVDFDAPSPTVKAVAAFSARIGQLVSFAVILGVKFLKIYLRDKKEQKAQLAAEKMTKEADQ